MSKEEELLFQNSCKIICTKGVKEYRQTIEKYITSQDTVLEIGFAWGTTTELLSKVCKHVVGIDKGESFYTAVMQYPELELYKIDGFDIREVRALGYNFNKIYIDISGCRELNTVIKIVRMYEQTFKPELIVVKSSKLKKLVARCEVWSG
jgi:16S rRNA A1518/A1519 N6-dimethyltransferase RsmA/KsgA/DIM1 with predicted DNA glycosylase/AP lyase activity